MVLDRPKSFLYLLSSKTRLFGKTNIRFEIYMTFLPIPNPRATFEVEPPIAAPAPQNTTEKVPKSSAMQARSNLPLTRSDFRGKKDQPPIC